MPSAIFTLVSLFALSGCSTIASQQYAAFDQFVAGKKNVNVIIDSLILSDIPGSDLGFNPEKNSAQRIYAQLCSPCPRPFLLSCPRNQTFCFTKLAINGRSLYSPHSSTPHSWA